MDSHLTNETGKRPTLFSPSTSGLVENKRRKSNADDDSTGNAITLLNQRTSPLLRLPAELRNKIYGYVCGGFLYGPSPSRDGHINTARFCDSAWSRWWKDEEDPTVLSRVCRQLHAETWTLPLELNTLRLFDLKNMRSFANLLTQEQRDAVRSIRMSVSAMKRVAEKTVNFWDEAFTRVLEQEDPKGEFLSPFLAFSNLEMMDAELGVAYGRGGFFDRADWLEYVPRRACEGMVRQLGGRQGWEIRYKR